jgi:hypothetical protein
MSSPRKLEAVLLDLGSNPDLKPGAAPIPTGPLAWHAAVAFYVAQVAKAVTRAVNGKNVAARDVPGVADPALQAPVAPESARLCNDNSGVSVEDLLRHRETIG